MFENHLNLTDSMILVKVNSFTYLIWDFVQNVKLTLDIEDMVTLKLRIIDMVPYLYNHISMDAVLTRYVLKYDPDIEKYAIAENKTFEILLELDWRILNKVVTFYTDL